MSAKRIVGPCDNHTFRPVRHQTGCETCGRADAEAQTKMAKTTTLTLEQLASLRTYLDKPNHGHGLFYGVTGQLYRAGYLTLAWTGAKDWTLSINAKGRRVLETPPNPNEDWCYECKATGKLTRLGGDWGKTPDTEVDCWRCNGKGLVAR